MLSARTVVQILVNGVNLSAIYALMALGFTMIFGVMRIVNFAHGEFAMLGGFALYYLLVQGHMPFVLALPVSALLVGAASLVAERLVMRPFYRQELQGLIATLGLSMIMTYLAVIIFDVNQRSVPPVDSRIFTFGPVILPADRLVVLGVAASALVLFFVFMRYTRTGLAMRVVAQDLEIAEAQGIDARAHYRVAFFIASGFAALAGGLLGQIYSVSPFMGVGPLIKSFIVVVLGGLGSIPGAALGGLLLGMSESALTTFYGASAAQFASFGAIMLILVLRPQGLLGRAERST
ncbi:MAG: branched-chain amino acid ABC transporter permease [Rhodospirillales bacterium]|nr:branched-chain amino acid ABC transporter permease [Rhodospirillales bacterium]